LRLGRDGRDNQPIRKPVDTLSIRAHPAVVFPCARQRSRPSINTWMSQWIRISLGWAWKRGWPSL
jgi:hypothetical protein